MDLSLMYCLAKHIPLNFPSLMIQHLTHCIIFNLTVGYGNLLTTIFKLNKLPLDPTPSFHLKKENVLDKEMLERHSLTLEHGVVVVLVPKVVEDVERDEEEVKFEENVSEQSAKRRKIEVGSSVRKSSRIASHIPKSTEAGEPTFVDLGDDGEGDIAPAHLPVDSDNMVHNQVPPPSPFHAETGILHTSGGTVGNELRKIKDLLVRLIDKVEHLERQLQDVKHEIFSNVRLNRAYVEDKIDKVATHFTRGDSSS